MNSATRAASSRRRLLIAAALATMLGAPLLLGGRGAMAALAALPASAFAAVLGLTALSWFARAVKLRLLMRRIGLRCGMAHALGITLASEFGFAVTPACVGGYLAGVHYLRRAGAGAAAAAMVTAADQLLDAAFFALALPLAALVLSGGAASHGTILPWRAASLALLVAAGLWLARRPLARLRSRRLRYWRRTLAAHVAAWRGEARRLLAGGPRWLAVLVALTALQWLARYGVLPLALALLGHGVPFALAFLAQSCVLHAAQWTGVPGGAGGAELGLGAVFAAVVPAADFAAAMLLWRLASFHVCLLAGAMAIAGLARHRQPPAAAVADAPRAG